MAAWIQAGPSRYPGCTNIALNRVITADDKDASLHVLGGCTRGNIYTGNVFGNPGGVQV